MVIAKVCIENKYNLLCLVLKANLVNKKKISCKSKKKMIRVF